MTSVQRMPIKDLQFRSSVIELVCFSSLCSTEDRWVEALGGLLSPGSVSSPVSHSRIGLSEVWWRGTAAFSDSGWCALLDRKRILAELLKDIEGPIKFSEHIESRLKYS